MFALFLLIGAAYVVGTSRQPDSKKEMEHIKSKVSKLAIIPTDEEPTLATVSDKTKLSDPILAQAENGDKVLLFYKSKRVFVYRPSTHRIVNIAPLILDPSAQEVEGSRIIVRNGNGNNALAESLRSKLQEKYPSAKISTLEPAARQNYPQTIVIDMTEGKKYNLVTNLMQHLGAGRGILPTGESKPENTDILIIVGLK